MKRTQKPSNFFKSSFSEVTGCVEVKYENNQVQVRDSKNKTGHVLTFDPYCWDFLLGGLKR